MVYLFKLILLCLLTIPYSLLMVTTGMLDWSGRIAYRLARGWSKGVLFLGGIRVRVSGEDQLDLNQAYVFMANHQSNVDIPVLISALPRFQLRWVAKRELLWVPFFGWGFWGCHMITIDRNSLRDAKSSIQQASRKLADGLSLVVFPEGTRSPDGNLLDFKRGGFVMAQNAGAAVVPITIKGSVNLLHKGSWRLKPGVVEIIISKPLPRQATAGDSRALSAQVRRIISADLGSVNNESVGLDGVGGLTRTTHESSGL